MGDCRLFVKFKSKQKGPEFPPGLSDSHSLSEAAYSSNTTTITITIMLR
jgi:hypothetical protein